ncbi:putative integral membrane protein [Rhizobium leguminosarum bv. trifolii WSM2297]|uniref:Putative integral membrane protein n=1 Tax=Rhizobium leguminosarum bv. trifolii WSM2297 TaxID=754762 RepID=J0L3I9_RHILT|nr:lysylphosphatidylglycerol synthase domain-containing protein [Rhizobium leguminosarum]EJC83610.1 putative integral membrane protein [Rhizobium leguminosarum bv. trifolii WSM2297]EJC84799.1 putative integral membrane protein [Rhizobium leguminosarum bv. trifolii WSM2297]
MSLKSMIWNGLLVAALCFAVFLLYRIFEQYSLDQIVQSVRSIPLSSFCTALLFAAASYLCLGCFDLLAIRSLGKSLPYPRIALASFISLSLGHNIGFAGLSSGAFRYRFYSRWGLTTEDVAKIILFCGVTVGLGLVTLGGLALIVNPSDAGRLLRLDRASVRIFGFLALIVPVVYLGLTFFIRGKLRLWRWSFQLPRFSIAVAQVAIGTINFMLVSACLHQMLSAFGDVAFFRSVTAYVLANSAILATHVPGGLGVLEATVSYAVPQEASIGALIAFRCAYFFIPLALGTTLLLISEIVFRRSRRTDEEADEGAEAQSA